MVVVGDAAVVTSVMDVGRTNSVVVVAGAVVDVTKVEVGEGTVVVVSGAAGDVEGEVVMVVS